MGIEERCQREESFVVAEAFLAFCESAEHNKQEKNTQ